MIPRKLPIIKNNFRGDTIIEVLITMTILGVVLGTAYATTTRSFHSGLNSQYRDQALLIAQQQVELLKSADINSPSTMDRYKTSPSEGFCINPSDLSMITLSPTQPTCPTPVGAPPESQSQFTLVDKYTSGPKVFTITTQWQSNNLTQNQVVLYYKASGSYVP